MSIAARLTAQLGEVKDIDDSITQFCHNISADQILKDPLYVDESTCSNPLASLSIYQLNQKQKDLDEGLLLLNELWLVKALFTEIEVSFDPFVSGRYVCDLDELFAIVSSLQKAEARIMALAEKKIAVLTSLQSQLERFRLTFISKLDLLFDLFFPAIDSVSESVRVNDGDQISLRDYVDFCEKHGNHFMDSYILNKFRDRRKSWENDFLQPLINNQILLVLDVQADRNTLRMIQAPDKPDLQLFLKSFQSFVLFINIIDLQSLKQYYSTTISNSLVELISHNIEVFMGAKELLTAELVKTIDLFTKTGWPMPLRNVFISTNKIQESLHTLYLNWLSDKYINDIRSTFQEPVFLSLFAEQESVEESVEIPVEQSHRNVPQVQPKEEPVLKDVSENQFAHEASDADWNDAWDSDIDEDATSAHGVQELSNEGEDNWNDDWNEDWEEDESEIPAKKSTAYPPVAPPLKTAEPGASKLSIEFEPRESVIVTEDRVFSRSAMSQKLSSILTSYKEQSNGANPQLLCDTILSLSLLTYPSFSDLLILLNDIDALENEYLRRKVRDQWVQFKQTFFKNAQTIIIESMEFDDIDLEVSIQKRSEKISSFVNSLFEKDLQKSNLHEFKAFLLQLCNMINNVAVEQVLSNEELSELQSENYTKVLQALQFIEGESMGRIGENVTKLASWPIVEQLIILLNNHLKDIMTYFYDSKLYAFSTEDLIKVIKSVFIPSDLREQCIQEILEIRNIQ